jgi:hypothetical protein
MDYYGDAIEAVTWSWLPISVYYQSRGHVEKFLLRYSVTSEPIPPVRKYLFLRPSTSFVYPKHSTPRFNEDQFSNEFSMRVQVTLLPLFVRWRSEITLNRRMSSLTLQRGKWVNLSDVNENLWTLFLCALFDAEWFVGTVPTRCIHHDV